MYNRNNSREGGATVVKTVCAALFLVFVAIYVFFYKEDTLALTQHVLSDGSTTYSRLIGGSIVVVALAMIQWTASQLMSRKPLCIYALSCFPSLYLLAMFSDFDPSREFSPWGWWVILMPVAAPLWWWTVYFLGEFTRYRFQDTRHDDNYTMKMLGINLFMLVAMMLGVGLMSNSSDVTHYRLRMERLLMHGEYGKALEVGKASDKADAQLTMLRVFALAREGRLGDELFSYPVRGTSSAMVPSLSGNGLYMLSPDSIYRLLGAIPRRGQSTADFLRAIVKSGQATPAVTDYQLCGMLMDKNLDGFVSLLLKTRKIDDNLPRHYREALILYAHRRSTPLVVYRNTVMDTDYADMQRLEAEAKTPEECRMKVFDQFAGTYWEYFDYSSDSQIHSAQ